MNRSISTDKHWGQTGGSLMDKEETRARQGSAGSGRGLLGFLSRIERFFQNEAWVRSGGGSW